MAQSDLKPVRTKDEAKIRGKNGGIASGKARRAKKIAAQTYAAAMRELMKRAYRTDLSTDEVKATCEAFGVNPTQSGAVALAFSDFYRALNGNDASMERVLNSVGATSAGEPAEQFESPTIIVMPATKDGEDVILDAEGEEDGEDP